MKSFLQQLERFVEIMDNKLQPPITRVLTGEVFTHDPTAHSPQDQPIQHAASPRVATPTTHKPQLADNNVLCPPRLQAAGARKK